MSKSVFIGFDFSMNKPACTILYDGKFDFFIWPASLKILTNANCQKYEEVGVHVINRMLTAISAEKADTSDVTLEHTIRSTKLADRIIYDIDQHLNKIDAQDAPIYISSEGLSFNSKGDATLNLATYKGVLLSKLWEHYPERLKGLYTYPPISIKAVAGCAKKTDIKDKNKMITAFMKEPIISEFKNGLINGKLTAKTNYIACVDDIVDSYFAVKTMLRNLGLIKK